MRHGFRRGPDGKKTPTYQSWCMMKERCTRTQKDGFHLYGGRGITFYEPWKHFTAFLSDLGPAPTYVNAHGATVSKTLDRIDPDGDYVPGNVRWATASEQGKNKRKKKAS